MTTDLTDDRREQICAWLRANGVDPEVVPIDAAWSIDRPADEPPTLSVEVFAVDSNGRKIADETGKSVAIETRRVPLAVEPPDWWQPRIKPTREELLKQLAALHAGEEPVSDAVTISTPGEFIYQWNRSSAQDRLHFAARWLEMREAFSTTPITAPGTWCGASQDLGFTEPTGPCALPAGHGGGMHRAINGTAWWPNPSGIITIPEPLTPKQAEAVRAEWERLHAQGRDPIPAVHLINADGRQHVEVWHTEQPEQYRITREQWVNATEPGQPDVRHIYEVAEAQPTEDRSE